MNWTGVEQFEDCPHINARWGQQLLSERVTVPAAFRGLPAVGQQLTDQRIAVRVRSGGGQADKLVAGANQGAIDDCILLHDANTKTGEIIIRFLVHAGHFSGLSAEQCRSCLTATFRYSLDDRCRDRRFQSTAAVVIQEEQRLGTLSYDIVYTHGDEVDTHGVMQLKFDSQF